MTWQKESAGFDIFSFENNHSKPVAIQDDADYLKLFMQVAEKIYREKKDKTTTFLCACTMGGGRLLIKPFENSEREQFKYSYIALANSLKQMQEADRPQQLNFFSEISFEDSNTPQFEKEAQKVAKMLNGENKDDWMVIAENKYNFLKTDMYVFSLLKLYSWGFQIVKSDETPDPKFSMVRPVKPKSRGAIREKRKRDK